MIVCFLDTETTGFSEKFNDLIQLAAIIYDMDTGEELETFNEYIKPRAAIPKDITNLTGITNADVKDAEPVWNVLKYFWQWCENHNVECLAGHNIDSFDKRFLYGKSDMFNIPHKDYQTIDTIKIARQLKKQKKFEFGAVNQPALAEYFGITYDAHNALNDVRCLLQIYYKLKERM